MTGSRFTVLLLCMAVVVFQPSCKKGCTDKKALNYAQGAKDNDGSCLYCDSTLQNLEGESRLIEDENPQSQFEFQDVLNVYVQSQGAAYTGNGCQKYNLGTLSSGSCVTLQHISGLVNETAATIVFNGQLIVSYEGGEQLSYNFNSALVGPFDTLKVGNIGTVCVPGEQQFFELQVQQGYSITYK